MLFGAVWGLGALILWIAGALLLLVSFAGAMFLLQWAVRVIIDSAVGRRAARREEVSQRAAR